MPEEVTSPERTCIGCRGREAQHRLIRLVAVNSDSDSSAITVDVRRRMSGRGAWLHPRQECFALANKKRAFARALNGVSDVKAVQEFLAQELLADPAPAESVRTVQPESGSEI
ncbi:YlxR family protein [Pseudarthrobacter sp. J1738]|uniref:YlxR family protein n=1 Tax=Pseudarthrobacter sp. J1738 TaxID=3420446 RepID=UPI003D2BD27B